MKTPATLCILLLWFFQTYAQFEHGKFSVGTSIGFTFFKDPVDNSVNKTFGLAGDLPCEYFLHRNFSIVFGTELEYVNSYAIRKETDSLNMVIESFERTDKQRMLAPLIGFRKYWFTPEGRFGFYVMPYASVAFEKRSSDQTFITPSSTTYDENEKSSWSPYFKTQIGACYFFKPNFSVEVSSLIFQAHAYKDQYYFYLFRNLGLKIGVRYYF